MMLRINDKNGLSKLAHDTKGVLLVNVWADWSTQCQNMSNVMRNLKTLLDDIDAIACIDWRHQKKLAKRLDVFGVPTLIIFISGQEVFRLSGIVDEEIILKHIAKLKNNTDSDKIISQSINHDGKLSFKAAQVGFLPNKELFRNTETRILQERSMDNMHSAFKLLIVEDNENFRLVFKELLINHYCSVIIEEAASGEEALKKLPTFSPDILFIDVELPGINGLEITKTIRASYGRSIGIIVHSNHNQEALEQTALDCGADAFFEKGTSIASISIVINNLLESYMPYR